jgi:hypothetical protein
MSDLTGSTISSTYNLLLTTESAVMGSGLQSIQSGTGVSSALKLSTTDVSVDGNLAVGTETATKQLTLGGGDPYLRLVDADEGTGTSNYLDIYQGTNSYVVGTHKLLLGAGGNNDGSTGINILADGKCGIGTTSPSNILHLRSATPQIYIQSDDGNDASIVFGDASDASRGQIKYTSSDDLVFLNNNLSERLRIDSSGNVGIGETASDVTVTGLNQLVVGTPGTGMNSGNTGIVIGSSTSESGALTFLDNVGSTIPGRIEYDHSVDSLYFKVNTSTRMTIDSSGNVNIGDSWSFNANGTGSWGENDDAGAFTWDTGKAIINAQGSNSLVLKPNAADGITINSSGDVGIGTSAPSEMLEVVGTSPSIKARASNAGGQAEIKLFGGDHASTEADKRAIVSDGNLIFKRQSGGNWVDDMTIDSSGHVILANVQEGDSGLASGTIYKDSGFLKIVA